jgi:hypothetical protein
MATIFEALEAALQGNGLDGALGAVTGSLTGASSLISGSKSKPPAGVAGFGAALRGLPLPDLNASSAFEATFDSLKAALPSNLASVTGGLTGGIKQLKSSGAELTGRLGESLQVVQAIYGLTQLDFQGKGQAPGPPPAAPPAGGPAPVPPPESAQSMEQVKNALDGLPSPLTVASFLPWLRDALDSITLDDFGIRQIPIITDLREMLGTLLSWKAADAAAVRAQLADTLAHLDAYLKGPLDPVLGQLSTAAGAFAGNLHGAELAGIADGLAARLSELKTPVQSGSLSGAGGTITALAALLDQYDALKPVLQTGLASLPAFENSLARLPDGLDDQLGSVVSALRPSISLGLVDDVAAAAEAGAAAIRKPIDELRHFLGRISAWLQDLLAKIDFKAVTQPIVEAANAMKSAVEALDNTMVAVTGQTQQVFGKVESALQLFDPATAAAQAKSAVDAFKAQIVQKVSGLLAPVLSEVNAVVGTIANAVAAFDPKQLEAVLHDALQKIAGVLTDPRVAAVRKDLDTVAAQLEAVSFAAFTDEVVKGLQAIADTLKSLGEIPGPLEGALQSALSVLPQDLKQITGPVLDEFGKIVNAGPVQALDAVADLPKQLADRVRAFDPATLVGDGLSEPYNRLLSDLQGFQPSSLLEPVRKELDSLKQRLRENLNPAQALAGLSAPFQELSSALDRFHPEEIIEPLNQQLKEVLSGISLTIPLDDVVGAAAAAIERVKSGIDMAVSATAMLDRARGILQAFAEPRVQLEAWLEPILEKLDQLGDTSALAASLTSISASVEGTTAAAVAAKTGTALSALETALTALNPQARWTGVVQAVRALPASQVDALPASAQKNALKAALSRLDLSQPAAGAPFQMLAGLQDKVAAAKSGLAAGLGDWDARYTAQGTVLGGLRGLQLDPGRLKQWVHDAVAEEFLDPLAAVFSLTAPAFGILDALVAELGNLVDEVQAKVADLLAGVAALQSIRNSLEELADRIRNFNLDFLRDSLTALFAALRAKLDAVNPRNLAQALDAVFDEVLDSLSVDLFLPPADVKKIDDDYAKLVEVLKSLDPANVLVTLVQDEFEKDVLPLLDAIDMSEPLHRIAERLGNLAGELETELGKVQDAFTAMRNAIPPGGGGSAAAGVGL